MALLGTEILQVLPVQSNGQPAATTEQTTTGAIAALAATESAPFIVTAITTVGNGTLTAAGLVGGEIVRTGPTGAFSDVTDTAVAIIAALPGVVVGSTFNVLIKNGTAFTQTMTAGAGVTLPPTVIVPAFSVYRAVATVATATTITMVHINTTPISVGASLTAPSATAINTVGAGTLTAAAINGGLISRGGSQSGTAFTDVTDTAALIIAACANLVNKIGTSMLVEVSNTTNAAMTVTGGTGVTVSGVAVIPPNTIGQFLLSYTASATMTMVGLGVTQNLATSVTILGSSTGSTALSSANAGTTNYTLTLPAVTDTVAVLGTAQTYTAAQTFTNSDLKLLGSSTGATTFTSDNGGASNFTMHVPAANDTLVTLAATQSLSNKTLVDVINQDVVATTATFNTVNTTTVATVTGLSINLTAGGTYQIRGQLQGSGINAGGIKAQFHGTNSLSLTSANITGFNYAGAVLNAVTNITALDADFSNFANTYTNIIFDGSLVVNAGGTINIQAAQHTSNGTTTTILAGSYMEVTRIS